MKLSICIPVYNGSATIAELVQRVEAVLSSPSRELEIVLVNDGSRDDSESVCTAIAERNPRVTFVALRRNFGEHNAVMCALNHCTGDYAAIIDDDFQNPPEEVIKLVDTAIAGRHDVVYSRYEVKKHAAYRNLGSKLNDMMCTWLLGKPHNLYLSSFKLVSRGLIDEIVQYRGPFPYIDGLILRATSSIGVVTVRHDDRQLGKSNYTLAKLISLWLNMFINFSVKPLRAFTLLGIAISSLSFIAMLALLIDKFLRPEMNYGWTSIMMAITFFAGIQLLSLGLISEYLGKQYLTTNGTPQWVVKQVVRTATS